MDTDASGSKLLRLATGVVAAYVSRTPVPAAELPEVIRLVFAALGKVEAPPADAQPEPAVPARKSVFPGHIVCLEDGMALKTLKRHLRTNHGLTPEAYRQRWGLPDSYPMVAPAYAATRSNLAKKAGLGRRPSRPATAEVAVQRVPEGAKGRRPGRTAPTPE